VLELFRIVGEAGGGARAPLADDARCPRCDLQLVRTFDQQRQSRFEYRRCPEGHGRLTSFFNFLREKNFLQPLSAAQIEDLRRNLRSINCSNCGAPVDLVKSTACAHCQSPLSILDVGQAERLVAALQQRRLRLVWRVRARSRLVQHGIERRPGQRGHRRLFSLAR
jgi:hypothetical protein